MGKGGVDGVSKEGEYMNIYIPKTRCKKVATQFKSDGYHCVIFSNSIPPGERGGERERKREGERERKEKSVLA